MAEDRIAVAQQVTRTWVKRKCRPQLLAGPFHRWVGGHVEVKNAPAVMGQHQKYVKHLEMQGWDGKEIDRDQLLQERAPGLGRWLVGTTMYLLTRSRRYRCRASAIHRGCVVRPRRDFRGTSGQISSRTSSASVGLPGWPRLIFHAQNRSKPLRCQALTLSG
jgi:hypothetical protein